jgi:hypothetical protein
MTAGRSPQGGRTLVAAARSGDTAAFERLLRTHDDQMRALAYRMLGSAPAMDDALQDAYLRAFGLGSTTGLEFPGEAPGMLMPHEDWWGSSLPTIAIGHGVAVTLMQLASAYGTIANDGVSMTPSVVRGTVGGDGRLFRMVKFRSMCVDAESGS